MDNYETFNNWIPAPAPDIIDPGPALDLIQGSPE
jgi:hypothetical protein